MTRNDFASLGSSAFAIVAKKRQVLVAADMAVDAADEDYYDNCKCEIRKDLPNRGCACGRREASRAANRARSEAYNDLRVAEAAWAEFCEIRRADIRG